MQAGYLAFLMGLAVIATACGNSTPPPPQTPQTPPSPAPQAAPSKVSAPAVDAEAAAVLGQLSYCGASAVAQSIWNRQNGQIEVAATLERGAYAYGKTAVEYGQGKGYAEAEVVALNRQNNDRVKDEIKAGFFFDEPSLRVKNENCLDLLRHTPGLADIWRRHAN